MKKLYFLIPLGTWIAGFFIWLAASSIGDFGWQATLKLLSMLVGGYATIFLLTWAIMENTNQ